MYLDKQSFLFSFVF
jgi:hypothetical protein